MNATDLAAATRLRNVIARVIGLQLDEAKLSELASILGRRLVALGLDEVDYVTLLEAPDAKEELGMLARELTVPETFFFRHMDQFNALREVALPEHLRASSGKRPLRILSAGCATGEEAYSIAIILREIGLDPRWAASIRAVDLNPAALKKARAGRYAAWALRETPKYLCERWFTHDGRDFQLSDDIRRAVTFEQRNLTDRDETLWTPSSYDIIFCRNAIMYLTPEKMREVAELIEQALVPGGHLFLGHAETLRGISDAFTLCQSHGAFYYRRAADKQTAKREQSRPATTHPAPAFKARVAPPAVDWMEAIDRSAQQIGRLAQAKPLAAKEDAAAATTRTLQSAQELARDERFHEALDQVEARLGVEPRNSQLCLFRAMLLVHCGRHEEAESTAQALLDRGHAEAGSHHVLALCREKNGDVDAARKHDRAAAYADASFAMPHLHLGLLARRAGQTTEMRQELTQAQFLLRREDAGRVALFGGGFTRQALIDLCATTLAQGDRG